MPSLGDLVSAYTRVPSWSVLLGGQPWRAIISLRTSQAFGSGISTATIVGRDPPVAPAIGTTVSFRWGYGGASDGTRPGFTGEIARPARKSYPNRYTIECRDVLWRADRSQQVIVTDPLNSILASAAVRYILTHYGGISASRINLPTFSASGSEWGGSEWTLGILTPVQWGDTDTNSGGTTALKAAQEICSVLGYWLYADAGGIIRAKQMERAPSLSAAHTFQRGVDLLTNGSPELVEDVDAVKNRIIVRGGNTGIDGAQIMDAFQTSHPVLPSGVYQEDTFSSFLIEYVNASEAGAASATEVAKRILKVKSRLPIVVRHRVKADPRLSVGATAGIIDSAIGYSTARNFFIYELETSLDCVTGDFSQNMTLDGGTGNSGYTTIPPPDASFSWLLMTETLDGDAVVEVALDGSGSTSLTEGEIVDWDWSTSTTTYGTTPDTATGVKVVFFFLQSAGTAEITLTVTDTTSKTGTITQTIDLTGADTQAPFREVVGAAAGAAWYVTPDGGASWNIETSNGAAIAVSTIGAGGDDRAPGTAGTYGMLATRGALGAGGLRRTLDTLATASTNLVSNAAAITSNIWVNEANPARVWFAIGTAVYRSVDGGATKTAMAVAAASVTWIMEDPALDNSIFLLAGANMYNATDPTIGYALLYAGPVGATARQFVRSRDGQVTWVCYTGAPSGEALQRVETGALADIAVTDIRTLALDREATSLLATLYAITADNPAELWHFDGLTGLSAAASSQTFPAGATVQHMLASRSFDVLYTADFDSVAAGTGALRKYFPSADLLLLWKELAVAQQGHMLGLGARAASPAEFLRMTISVDPGGVWHYKDSAWTFRPLPVSGTVRGIAVVADPFNASRWLAIFNNTSTKCFNASGVIHGHDWAHSPLWETEDAGVTWTEVVITTPGGWTDDECFLRYATFNDQTGNSWVAAFGDGGSYYTAIAKGSSATGSIVTESTNHSMVGSCSGTEGEFVFAAGYSASDDGLIYLDTGNALHRTSGSQPLDMIFDPLDRMPGTSRAVLFCDSALYATTDYRASQPTLLLTAGGNAKAVSCGTAAIYYIQADGDMWRVVDPFGAATQTQLVFGAVQTNPRVDRQTRTIGAVATGGGIVIDDGTTMHTISGPTGSLSRIVDGADGAFEVMVRP